MTSLTVQPHLIATAAADASQIGSTIDQARAAAASSTTNLAAAAEDEVSAVTAAFFEGFGADYQALLQQATAFQQQFVAALSGAGNAYAQAEIEAQTALGITGAAAPTFTTVTQSADPAVTAIMIMSGSGTATPSQSFMQSVAGLYLSNFTSVNPLQAVSTAEGLYPVSGVKDLTLDISLARGVTELDNAINLAIHPGTGTLAIFGDSQSSILASLEMPKLLAEGFTPSQITFSLVGNEFNPNGGLLARFPGLSVPSVGITFGGSTPSNDFPTTIWTLEYDGFADFPQYPIDIFSDLNALAGIAFVHGTYSTLTASQVGMALTLPQSGAPSMTTYELIPTANLPLLDPLRIIPVIGNPLADLIQPDLAALVNWGYGNPAYGFSTGPADLQTPFGFLPPLADTLALGPALVAGTQAGVGAFAADLSGLVPTSLPALSLPNLSLSSLAGALTGGSAGSGALGLPSLTSIPSVVTSLISDIQSANDNIVGAFAGDLSTAYATLLPTADLLTAVAVSVPSYDFNLFLNGISQAINGQPLLGLENAIGDPIAATVGLDTLAGGIELFSVVNTLETIFTGAPNPGPF